MRLIETARFLALGLALTAGSAFAQTSTAPSAPAHPAAQAAPPAPAARDWQRFVRAREVQIRDVAAIVRVRPENRTDVAVAITNGGPLPEAQLRLNGNRLVIDGQMRRQIRSCRVVGDELSVDTRRNGRIGAGQVMVIDLRVPQDAVVSAGGAVRLRMAPAQSARIRIEGCGAADIERIEDEADLAVSGSSDVRVYDAGTATVALAGAGEVTVGVVRNGLTASIAGAGDLTVARADGPTTIAVQGAGDVAIRDGHATSLSVVIAGAGDVVHNGVADRLDATIIGAGDVRVRRVTGEVNRRVIGGGDVVVGR